MSQQMTHYIGTKIVTAAPMTRQEYNDYRGWQLPADEDGTDTGYLVEYLDGGAANHPDHAGYISWSPRAIFESAYVGMGNVSHLQPHQQRMVAEKTALDDKLQKLANFFATDTYAALYEAERDRLSYQKHSMQEYSNVLREHIEAF